MNEHPLTDCSIVALYVLQLVTKFFQVSLNLGLPKLDSDCNVSHLNQVCVVRIGIAVEHMHLSWQT